jgi:hypothetical protein
MKTRSKTASISKIEVASIIASISKTDKNNKLKKRKIQQTLDRKVNRALKTLPFHDIEEQEQQEQEQQEQESNSIYKTLQQVSQISYLGSTIPLFWNPLEKKVYVEISTEEIYFNKNVIVYDDDCFAQYEDSTILDIIHQHFGTVHIFSQDTSNIRSSSSLYSLVSTIPLTQYTLVNLSYDCGNY